MAGSAVLARTVATRVAIGLGCLLTAAAIVAGLANRELLDEGRFSRHVNSVRLDAAVSAQVGEAITAQVLSLQPNLVMLKPVIETSATALVRSSQFTPIALGVARQLHRTLTRPNSGQIVLRLADVGAVLVPTLRALAPTLAAKLPPDFDVTLSRIGAQEFAGHTLHVAYRIRLLAWLLPLLALSCFLLALALARNRRAIIGTIGAAITGGALLVGVAALVVNTVITSTSRQSGLRAAVVHAGWQSLTPSVRASVVTVVVAGVLMLCFASGWAARAADAVRRAVVLIARPPVSPWAATVQIVVLVGLGLLLVAAPNETIQVVAIALGMGMIALAVARFAQLRTAASTPLPTRAVGTSAMAVSPQTRRPVWPVVGLSLGVVTLIGLTLLGTRPTLGSDPAPAAAQPAKVCNGYAVLCERPYNDVAFPATHNSMSAADQPGWLFAEQPDGIVAQLNAGIRVLLFDTWLGQPTQQRGIVITSEALRARAKAVSDEDFGPAAVASALRVRDALGLRPRGPAQPYLCHGFCEFGATAWEPVMAQVRQWLVDHPRDVVTFFIQDEGVTPAQTNQVFQQAGLLPYVYTQPAGQSSWPTLGQMINSGHRLVVLMENQDGGTQYPWQLPGFAWAQDTPYHYTSADQFSCTRLRGSENGPLFLINHWLSNGNRRVTDSAAVNSYNVLWPRVSQCQQQRGQIPNFVAVNFYNEGDLEPVVNQLNGVA